LIALSKEVRYIKEICMRDKSKKDKLKQDKHQKQAHEKKLEDKELGKIHGGKGRVVDTIQFGLSDSTPTP
jgi:hypothetical protein